MDVYLIIAVIAVIALVAYGAQDQLQTYRKKFQHFCDLRVAGEDAPYVSERSNFSPDRPGSCMRTGPNAWAADTESNALAVINGK
jgi:hypothetical protein